MNAFDDPNFVDGSPFLSKNTYHNNKLNFLDISKLIFIKTAVTSSLL